MFESELLFTESKLKYCVREKISDGPHETPKFLDDGIPFLSVDGIQNGKIILDNCRFISEEDHKKYNDKIKVEEDDILMGKAASIGKIARVTFNRPISIWSPLAVIKCKKRVINPIFLEYFLKSDLVQNQIQILATSNTQQNISMRDIERIKVSYPNLIHQGLISRYLDKKTKAIDSIIEKTKKKIELLREQKTALIHQYVTKGLDPNVEIRDSGIELIGDIPKDWKVKKLGYLCCLRGRIGFKGYTKEDLVSKDQGALVIGGKHIDSEQKLNLKNPDYIKWDKYYESPEIMVKKEDLIISQRGTLGKVVFINQDYGAMTINPSLVLLNSITIFPKFLWYFLQSNYIISTTFLMNQGSAVPMLSQEQISNFKIVVPSKEEQREITQFLDKKIDAISKITNKEKEKIELLKEYRQSLISSVVTGKILITEEMA